MYTIFAVGYKTDVKLYTLNSRYITEFLFRRNHTVYVCMCICGLDVTHAPLRTFGWVYLLAHNFVR